MNERSAFSIKEFSERSGLSVATIYRRLKDGSLRSVQIGGRRLIPADVERELLAGEPGSRNSDQAA
ncbi:excisionase family DNA-binding protein [Dongia sp.]|uniref:excisionase family DNA-binding protein n=1 Tax=Dongia sp. TaxID=1977262 RepID=UPI003753BE39